MMVYNGVSAVEQSAIDNYFMNTFDLSPVAVINITYPSELNEGDSGKIVFTRNFASSSDVVIPFAYSGNATESVDFNLGFQIK